MDNQTCFSINFILRQRKNDFTTYDSSKGIFGLIYGIIILAALLGNLCVIVAIARHKVERNSVRNLFIVSLSCSDIAVCFFSGIITPTTAFSKQWLFGKVMCYLAPEVQGMTISVSTFTLTAIAIDRYILIIYPTKRPIQFKHVPKIIAIIWALAAIHVMPGSFNQVLSTYDGVCGKFCVENWAQGPLGAIHGPRAQVVFGASVLIIQFLIPLVVISYCYLRIYMTLKKSMQMRMTRRNSQNAQRDAQILRRRQKTNRMLVAMVTVFGISWAPLVIFNLLRDSGNLPFFMKNQGYFFGLIMHSIAMTSTFWNPILYAWFNDRLREAFLELIPEKFRSRRDENERKEMEMTETQRAAHTIRVRMQQRGRNPSETEMFLLSTHKTENMLITTSGLENSNEDIDL